MVVFAIEALETRVAMVRSAPDPFPALFAGHLEGDQPILDVPRRRSRSGQSHSATATSRVGVNFEIPYGPGVEVTAHRPSRRDPLRWTVACRASSPALTNTSVLGPTACCRVEETRQLTGEPESRCLSQVSGSRLGVHGHDEL